MGHSSTVKMWLHVADAKLPVLQSSATEIKLNPTHPIPQGDALLETIVDGRSHRRPIRMLAPSELPNWVTIADR